MKGDDRLDEKAESPLGRLSLTGERVDGKFKPFITAEQHDAGALYAHVVGAYRSVIEGPRSTGGSGRGFECGSEVGNPIERQVRVGAAVITMRAWPCGASDDGCGCARRKARYDGAFEAVMRAGQRAAKAVARVAVHREDLAPQDLVYLVEGLRALARHFGLTERRSSGHSRNAN